MSVIKECSSCDMYQGGVCSKFNIRVSVNATWCKDYTPKATAKQIILDTIDDLCSKFVYYDRKNDEQLSMDQLNTAVEKKEITVDEMVSKFKTCLENIFYNQK